MKKNYLKPEIEQINLFVEAAILINSNDNESTIPGAGEGGGNGTLEEPNKSRGQWGNVWGK